MTSLYATLPPSTATACRPTVAMRSGTVTPISRQQQAAPAEATASPARHFNSEHSTHIHPRIQQQIDYCGESKGWLAATMRGNQVSGVTTQNNPPTDIPRVTVTGHRTDSFGGSNGLMFQALFQAPYPPPYDEYNDSIDPEGPDPDLWFDAELVVENSDFYADLPPDAQAAVLSSPTLTAQLAQFIIGGREVRFGNTPPGTTGQYDVATQTITINSSVKQGLLAGDTYSIETFIGTLAHEVSHQITTFNGFSLDTSSRAAYIDSGLLSEAYAVLNVMLIIHEVTNAGHTQMFHDRRQ